MKRGRFEGCLQQYGCLSLRVRADNLINRMVDVLLVIFVL